MQKEQKTLILTLRPDADSQEFFDRLCGRHFPLERNFLKAHLTVFHPLRDESGTQEYLAGLAQSVFGLDVTGLRHLGAGVAYQLASADLATLHRR